MSCLVFVHLNLLKPNQCLFTPFLYHGPQGKGPRDQQILSFKTLIEISSKECGMADKNMSVDGWSLCCSYNLQHIVGGLASLIKHNASRSFKIFTLH